MRLLFGHCLRRSTLGDFPKLQAQRLHACAARRQIAKMGLPTSPRHPHLLNLNLVAVTAEVIVRAKLSESVEAEVCREPRLSV